MSDLSSVVDDLIVLQSFYTGGQPALWHVVHRDDLDLLRSDEGEWLRCLYTLDWREYRDVGAQYYQALWDFNIKAARERVARVSWPTNPERPEEAQQRLYEARPTGGAQGIPLIIPVQEELPISPEVVRPEAIAPGVVPIRFAGKPPKCFFAMFKAFIGVHVMGKGASALEVRHYLTLSPPFVRACGFTMPDRNAGYRQSDYPSLRKLEQFEQIMSDRGLWTQARVQTIRQNLGNGTIEIKGQRLVLDTTHYVAYSTMTLHELPPGNGTEQEIAQPASREVRPRRTRAVRRQEKQTRRHAMREAARERWQERRANKRQQRRKKSIPASVKRTSPKKDPQAPGEESKSEKPVRKTQSKTIKNCRCLDREECPHPWVLADPGAGSIIKGTGAHKKKHWGHKASVLSTTDGVPLDAQAATDAASHDGTFLKPHLDVFFETHPDLLGVFKELLADTAYDSPEDKQAVEEAYGIRVRTPTNPRRIKTLLQGDLPKGMKNLTPAGTLICQADREMEYRGARFKTEKFVYGPPGGRVGLPACTSCPLRDACCREDSTEGRRVEIPFIQLDHIDPGDPPMARRFKAAMRMRGAVERAIKRIKLDFSQERLTRRGHEAFQAHLDRSLIAFHLMLRLR
jgi:hypothetical protein